MFWVSPLAQLDEKVARAKICDGSSLIGGFTDLTPHVKMRGVGLAVLFIVCLPARWPSQPIKATYN